MSLARLVGSERRILFLDDQPIRHGYFAAQRPGEIIVHVFTYDQAVIALTRHAFSEAHLDHDLDDFSGGAACGYNAPPGLTGYDVAVFISRLPDPMRPHAVVVHSWNPDGARKMASVLRDAGVAVTQKPFTVPKELLAGVGNFALEQEHTRLEPQEKQDDT